MKRFRFRIDSRVWIVALCTVLGLVLATAATAVMPRTYTATTVLFIGSPASGDSAGAYQGDLFSQQRAATYAQLFAGDDLAVKVNDDLRLGLTPAELSSKVTAAAVEKTVLLQVDVTDSTATGAADIANAYASNFAAYVGELENPDGRGEASSLVSVVSRAEAPAAPTSPSSTINLAAGFVGGLLIGLLIVWLRRRFDSAVRTDEDAASASGAPVVGHLHADADRDRSLLTLPEDSTSDFAEEIRKLRTTLQFVDADSSVRSILVTAADADGRADVVAAHLALMLAEVGRTVALLDADLRESSLTAYLGMDRKATIGLADVLTGAVMVEDATVGIADDRVSLVPSGSGSVTPGEDIATDLMRNVVAELGRTFDYVIVLSPPAADYADAAVIGASVDGVLLVVRAGRTGSTELRTAAETVRSTGARVLGSVLVDGRGTRSRTPATRKKSPTVVAAQPKTPAAAPERVMVEPLSLPAGVPAGPPTDDHVPAYPVEYGYDQYEEGDAAYRNGFGAPQRGRDPYADDRRVRPGFVPPREYDRRPTGDPRYPDPSWSQSEGRRYEGPPYEGPRYEGPRYEGPRYEGPRGYRPSQFSPPRQDPRFDDRRPPRRPDLDSHSQGGARSEWVVRDGSMPDASRDYDASVAYEYTDQWVEDVQPVVDRTGEVREQSAGTWPPVDDDIADAVVVDEPNGYADAAEAAFDDDHVTDDEQDDAEWAPASPVRRAAPVATDRVLADDDPALDDAGVASDAPAADSDETDDVAGDELASTDVDLVDDADLPVDDMDEHTDSDDDDEALAGEASGDVVEGSAPESSDVTDGESAEAGDEVSEETDQLDAGESEADDADPSEVEFEVDDAVADVDAEESADDEGGQESDTAPAASVTRPRPDGEQPVNSAAAKRPAPAQSLARKSPTRNGFAFPGHNNGRTR